MSFNEIVIILIIGLSAGLLNGSMGVGGGILIVPALVFILGFSYLKSTPLFDNSTSTAQKNKTLAMSNQKYYELLAKREQSLIELQQTYYQILASNAQHKALESAKYSAQTALEANQLGYKVGMRINAEVLDAQVKLHDTKKQSLDSWYNSWKKYIKLNQLAGTLTYYELSRIDNLVKPVEYLSEQPTVDFKSLSLESLQTNNTNVASSSPENGLVSPAKNNLENNLENLKITNPPVHYIENIVNKEPFDLMKELQQDMNDVHLTENYQNNAPKANSVYLITGISMTPTISELLHVKSTR